MNSKVFLGLLLSVLFAFAGCSEPVDVPPSPQEPGSSGSLVGQATTTVQDVLVSLSSPRNNFQVNPDEAEVSVSSSVTIEVSHDDTVVWNTGYYLDSDNSWSAFSLSGDSYGSTNWISGDATGEFSVDDSDVGSSAVLVYSCTRDNSAWDCGDNWQGHEFSVEEIQSAEVSLSCYVVGYTGDIVEIDQGSSLAFKIESGDAGTCTLNPGFGTGNTGSCDRQFTMTFTQTGNFTPSVHLTSDGSVSASCGKIISVTCGSSQCEANNQCYDDGAERNGEVCTDGEFVAPATDPSDPSDFSGDGYTCTSSSIVGDIDGDGEVTSDDAELASKISIGSIELSTDNICCADASGDGNLNSFDGAVIMRYANGDYSNGVVGKACDYNQSTSTESNLQVSASTAWPSCEGFDVVIDVSSSLELSDVDLYVDGSLIEGLELASGDTEASAEITVDSLESGEHSVEVRATDVSGATANKSITGSTASC